MKEEDRPMVYVSDVELARRFAVSRVTIWRWSSQGILPKPVKIGPNCSRWQAEEIETVEARWLAARERRFGKPLLPEGGGEEGGESPQDTAAVPAASPRGPRKKREPFRGDIKQKARAKPKAKSARRHRAQEGPRQEQVEG
jgi:prophage regulatory protein